MQNDYVHDLWRLVQWEFNMEQRDRIVQESILKLDVIFEGNDLVASISCSTCKGYQQTFPNSIVSAQASNNCNKSNGIMCVCLEEPAVSQMR